MKPIHIIAIALFVIAVVLVKRELKDHQIESVKQEQVEAAVKNRNERLQESRKQRERTKKLFGGQ